MGKVVIGPRNFYTAKGIPGKNPDACLFSKPGYNAIGDPFKMAGKAIASKKPETAYAHDFAFKPYGTEKKKKPFVPKAYLKDVVVKPNAAAVPWMKDAPEAKDPKRLRDADGFIVTAPQNVLTGPGKKGRVGRRQDVTFEKFPAHISEDYNLVKKLRKKELDEHHALLQDMPFSEAAKRKAYFFSNK